MKSTVLNALRSFYPVYSIFASRVEMNISKIREQYGHDITYWTILPLVRGVKEAYPRVLSKSNEAPGERLYLFFLIALALFSSLGPIVGVSDSSARSWIQGIHFSSHNLSRAVTELFDR